MIVITRNFVVYFLQFNLNAGYLSVVKVKEPMKLEEAWLVLSNSHEFLDLKADHQLRSFFWLNSSSEYLFFYKSPENAIGYDLRAAHIGIESLKVNISKSLVLSSYQSFGFFSVEQNNGSTTIVNNGDSSRKNLCWNKSKLILIDSGKNACRHFDIPILTGFTITKSIYLFSKDLVFIFPWVDGVIDSKSYRDVFCYSFLPALIIQMLYLTALFIAAVMTIAIVGLGLLKKYTKVSTTFRIMSSSSSSGSRRRRRSEETLLKITNGKKNIKRKKSFRSEVLMKNKKSIVKTEISSSVMSKNSSDVSPDHYIRPMQESRPILEPDDDNDDVDVEKTIE